GKTKDPCVQGGLFLPPDKTVYQKEAHPLGEYIPDPIHLFFGKMYLQYYHHLYTFMAYGSGSRTWAATPLDQRSSGPFGPASKRYIPKI
ncbi:MAG: hypothetical protein ACE5I8_11360, partial [Thermodesulfobacteriota bacterium]